MQKKETSQTIPAVILATAAFMAIVGKAKGSTVDIRLVGMGIPALAHIAAALALAISNNWSLSKTHKDKAQLRCRRECLLIFRQVCKNNLVCDWRTRSVREVISSDLVR